ncbi:hypothetical protein HOY82DRAFT_652050 [Tuber indicum]|nr:hypothetical protein HOY82DRAFT_652050 [Tuber indicum]
MDTIVIHLPGNLVYREFLNEFTRSEKPSSDPELPSEISYLATELVVEGEDYARGTYEEILRLGLTELERSFRYVNEVHAMAAQLSAVFRKFVDRGAETVRRRLGARLGCGGA